MVAACCQKPAEVIGQFGEGMIGLWLDDLDDGADVFEIAPYPDR
jgi:hypothetical protein